MNSRVFIRRVREKVVRKNLARYTDNCGSQVRSGRRQSMPSSSIDNCARVSETVPLAGLRPHEASALQPLREQAQDVFIMPLFTMWLISRELSGPKTVPWGRIFRAVRDQVGA